MLRASEILEVLAKNPGFTAKDIRLALNIERRTLYMCLKRLMNNNLIVERMSLKDARQNHYFVIGVQ